MSIADIVSVSQNRPPIITIAGEMGMGKTSIPWTDPIFICTEDGLQSIPVERRPPSFPLANTRNQVADYLSMLIQEEHEYKTLVIDSISKLDAIVESELVKEDKNEPASINQAYGGYGNGPKAVGAFHQRVRKACEILNTKKNMTIVFLSHAETETIDLPLAEPYTRFTLRLGRRSIPPYTDDVDIVGMLRLQQYVRGVEKNKSDEVIKAGKVITDGTRVIKCTANASSLSKNRYGIDQDIPLKLGANPLLDLIPYFNTQKNKGEQL
jgi:hypothetical protein